MGDVVVDSSVLLSILLNEPDAKNLIERLKHSASIHLSAAGFAESGIVVTQRRFEQLTISHLHVLIDRFAIEIAPFTEQHATLAWEAYAQFGKGNHPAKLNMGDCFAYALAKDMDLPLLYKGNDFAQTDIASAMESH